MKELSTLKTLVESPVPSSMERQRRAFFAMADRPVDQLESIVSGQGNEGGSKLRAMLKDGGFPETEANDLKKKFHEFIDAYEDFKMRMLIEFDSMD